MAALGRPISELERPPLAGRRQSGSVCEMGAFDPDRSLESVCFATSDSALTTAPVVQLRVFGTRAIVPTTIAIASLCLVSIFLVGIVRGPDLVIVLKRSTPESPQFNGREKEW
jgi:hypothetical protein